MLLSTHRIVEAIIKPWRAPMKFVMSTLTVLFLLALMGCSQNSSSTPEGEDITDLVGDQATQDVVVDVGLDRQQAELDEDLPRIDGGEAHTGDAQSPSPPCSGPTENGEGRYACVRVNSSEKAAIHERVAGYNLSVKNHGLAVWDNRVLDIARRQFMGSVRFPDVSYSSNWRSGQLERDWILRFEPDDVCDPTKPSACTGEFNHSSEICAPQPTAAHPETHQCQRPCTAATEAQDCDSGEICHFGQCALACVGAADLSTCQAQDTYVDPNGQVQNNLVQRNRECARGDDGRWGCVGSKVANYLGYEEVVSGKGFSTLGDFARFAESVGAQILVHANTMTDSPESLYDLANEVIERQVDVGAWLLALETFYFRSTNSPPTFWLTGWDYAADMERYITKIEQAYAEHQMTPPIITLAFSDHETDWQSVWDAGKDFAVDPTANDNKPGLGDYIAANGRSFSASDFHWYPGNGSTPFAEAEVLVNEHLQQYAIQNVDNYFLPLSCADTNGICEDPDDPKITVTEFNIQTTWSSSLAAVHASEFMLRLADHPRMAILGYHSLTDGCLDTFDNHRYSAKYADRYNVYGTFDSNVIDDADGSQAVIFGEVTSLSCLALRLVNRAVNTSENAYATEIEADDLPNDPDGVLWGDTGPSEEGTEGPKLYAKAFEGENEDFLILTNRSDIPHTVTPYWNGEKLQRSGTLEVLSGEAPQNRNCFSPDQSVGQGEVCAAIDLEQAQAWNPGDPLVVPAWGVASLSLPRKAKGLPAVEGLAVTPGPRSASVSFSRVSGATAYDVRYGVTGGDHTRRLRLEDSTCSEPCTLSLSNLAHDVEHSLSVVAIDGEERGERGESRTFTPTRIERFTGLWGTPDGDATWTEDQGIIQINVGTLPTYLPMVDGSGALVSLEDYSFEGEFRLTSCSCDPDIGTSSYAGSEVACERFGLSARYTDSNNLNLGYLEHKPGYGCYFRLSRKYENDNGSFSDVLNRSPYIGVPIEQSPGVTRLDSWGNPAYPQIPSVDDGEWHALRISVDEQVVRVWLDGRLIAATQEFELESGGVALFSRRQDVEWRNFSVWEAPW